MVTFIDAILEPDGAAYSTYGVRLVVFEASPEQSHEGIQEYIDRVQPCLA